MKKRNNPKPIKHHATTFHQLCKLIPVGMVRNLAKLVQSREPSLPGAICGHLTVSQLTQSISLNNVCDALRDHAARLFAIRAASVPSRNGLSHISNSHFGVQKCELEIL